VKDRLDRDFLDGGMNKRPHDTYSIFPFFRSSNILNF
jgi:hypothetical protein